MGTRRAIADALTILHLPGRHVVVAGRRVLRDIINYYSKNGFFPRENRRLEIELRCTEDDAQYARRQTVRRVGRQRARAHGGRVGDAGTAAAAAATVNYDHGPLLSRWRARSRRL